MRSAAYREEDSRIVQLAIRDILPDPCGAHRLWPLEEIARLAERIAVYGVERPLTVRAIGGCYQLRSGDQTLKAAALAGFTHVPCVVERASVSSAANESFERTGRRAYFAQLAAMTAAHSAEPAPEPEDELAPYPLKPPRCKPLIRDVRLLVNTVQRACQTLSSGGIHAAMEQTETADELCLTVRVAKPAEILRKKEA